MAKTEYKKAIASALSETVSAGDPVSAVRTILSRCEADFPYGSCQGVLASLSENNFTRWRECSYEEAKAYAEKGVPTVGISSERVVLIAPDGGEQYDSEVVSQAASLTDDESAELKFFAYSETLATYNYGSVSDVPSSLSADGFAGWYVPAPSCANQGVIANVPRFAQLAWGPCVAYSIMMGDYYLNYRSSYSNASTWFNNNVSTYYNSSVGATAYANSLVNIVEYSMSALKAQLYLRKPVVISGATSSGTRHMALAVAYVGSGTATSQYVIVDPLAISGSAAPFYTTFDEFKTRCPNTTTYSGVSNPMLTFK